MLIFGIGSRKFYFRNIFLK